MTFDVDLLDPDLHASGRALEVLARLRDEQPVAWCRGRRGRGYWSVTGHAELCEAARRPETFSSWWGTRPEVTRPPDALRPLHNLDPPEHRRVRDVAERALARTPSAAIVARDHVARFADAGGGDVVRAIAEPVPALLVAEWMGLAPDDARAIAARVVEVHEAGAALLDTAKDDPARPERVARARSATEAIGDFFRGAIGSADEGALAIVRAAREAGKLGDDETVALAALLVEAGLPTLVDAIGGAIADVVAHPEVVDVAKDTRSRARLVEELLRRASPIAQFARRARRDAVLGGARIAEGDAIVLWFCAANRDPRVFRDPDALVAGRVPNPHVAFGAGAHHCVGAKLARAVLDEVIAAWCAIVGTRAVTVRDVRRRSSYLRGPAQLDVDVAPAAGGRIL